MKFKSLFTITLITFSFIFILNSFTYAQTGWTKKPDVNGQLSNKNVKGGGGIAAVGSDVYLIIGNNTRDLMKYDNITSTWSAIDSSVPIGPRMKRVKKGACIVNDGENVYVFKGGGTNEFFKYRPLDGLWDTLPTPDFRKGMKGGFACYVSYQGGKFIYAGSGSNTNEWKRFNITANLWETPIPETLPLRKVKVGSGLAYDGSGILYLLLGGGRENYFYTCDLNSATPQWTQQISMPFYPPDNLKKKKVKEGGSIEYAGGNIYAVKGGSTKGFWCYDPVAIGWNYLGEIIGADSIAPKKGIKTGRSLTYSTAGGIFCIIGNNTNEFWFYSTASLPSGSNEPKLTGNSNIENTGSTNPISNSRIGSNFNHIQTNANATSIRVYKISGELLISEKGTSSIGRLPVGVYIVRYEGNGINESTKLIVAR